MAETVTSVFGGHTGPDIVTARALALADDGMRTTVITAADGVQSFSMRFSSMIKAILHDGIARDVSLHASPIYRP